MGRGFLSLVRVSGRKTISRSIKDLPVDFLELKVGRFAPDAFPRLEFVSFACDGCILVERNSLDGMWREG